MPTKSFMNGPCRTFTTRRSGTSNHAVLSPFCSGLSPIQTMLCTLTLLLRLWFHRIQERQECTSHHLPSLPAAAPSSQTLHNNTPSDVFMPCCNVKKMSHRACESPTDTAADNSRRLLLIQLARLIWRTRKKAMLMYKIRAPAAVGIGQQLHTKRLSGKALQC